MSNQSHVYYVVLVLKIGQYSNGMTWLQQLGYFGDQIDSIGNSAKILQLPSKVQLILK